jgi:hypothetical protein
LCRSTAYDRVTLPQPRPPLNRTSRLGRVMILPFTIPNKSEPWRVICTLMSLPRPPHRPIPVVTNPLMILQLYFGADESIQQVKIPTHTTPQHPTDLCSKLLRPAIPSEAYTKVFAFRIVVDPPELDVSGPSAAVRETENVGGVGEVATDFVDEFVGQVA